MSSLVPLVARDLSKTYGDRRVLDGVEVVANPGEPVGLVGENGVGKSTLLRLLAGVEASDSGEVHGPDDVGYLPQHPEFAPGSTVQSVLSQALAPLHAAVSRIERLASLLDDEACAAEYAAALEWAEHHGAWDADRRAQVALSRLGLDTLSIDRSAARLSGGQRSRLALAALIARRPDAVILDEPTNHLDDEAMEFVEDFLLTLPGVSVVATHDRTFLDNACHVIVDLDSSHFGVDGFGGNRYAGSYSAYLSHRQRSRQRWLGAFEEQREELHELRTAAKTTARQVAHNRPARDNDKYWYHFKGGNVQSTIRRRVRDAEQRIEAIERDLIPKPPSELSFGRPLTGDAGGPAATVTARDIEVAGRLHLDRLDVSQGEKLLLTGANGSGKSTLLALIAGILPPDAGWLDVAAQRVALLPQDVSFGDSARTAREVYTAKVGTAVSLADLGLLHPRDIDRPVSVLSLGQQRRLALAMAVASRPDLLLLDEPTNHISLALANELEQAMGRSAGNVIVASHDRWLRARWAGTTLDLRAINPSGR